MKNKKNRHTSYNTNFSPYKVRILKPEENNRKKILHVIGNFWTGGSARLVVDLVEHLGHEYEQQIVTRDIPDRPAYTGISIILCREMNNITEILSILNKFGPQILHIHYLGHQRDKWGQEDFQWYRLFFKAAREYGCKIVENINIPTVPYISDSVGHYVYVSNFVKNEYGLQGPQHVVIYPGSDFTHFKRFDQNDIPDNCIGMVYRLERDKLNENSIDALIEVVKRRSGTKALIVGGGSLLEHYRNAVVSAGLVDSFLFTGYVAYKDLPDYYKKMSVFVAPVHRESFGQVTPFAMNMGIPVAGYAVGALPEIIGNNLLLAHPGDYQNLADIIVELLDDRKKRLIIGAENQQRAKIFSVEVMINRYREIYNETCYG